MPDDLPKLLYTQAEAAQMLGISVKSFLEIVRRGEIRIVRIGARRKFSMADIQAFIEQQSERVYLPRIGKGTVVKPRRREQVYDFEIMRAQRIAERKRQRELRKR